MRHRDSSPTQLTQLVYVSSYVDEYGVGLPDFIGKSALANQDLGVRGMTLFAHGNIIQMLEGVHKAVNAVFKELPSGTMQFQVIQMLHEPLEKACLEETSIGFNHRALVLVKSVPPNVALFKLSPKAVGKRIRESPGKLLMQQFASDYEQ
jgi:hypothetical protein